MSDTQVDAPPPTEAVVPKPNIDYEKSAKIMGWRPKEEFNGDPDKWVPADQFVENSLTNSHMMAERLKFLTDRWEKMERQNSQVSTKLDEALGTVNTMTTMVRSAEERAYKRAKAELEQQRRAAVETGDTAAFDRADRQLQELTPPPEPPKPAPAPVAQPAAQTGLDPAVEAFFQRNRWYKQDHAMTGLADGTYLQSKQDNPHWSEEQHLQAVESRVRSLFPAKFGAVSDNPRREEPASVSGSTPNAAPRRQRNSRTFDAMPEESKRAYERYAAQIEAKRANAGDRVKSLTKEEWATMYWEQEE